MESNSRLFHQPGGGVRSSACWVSAALKERAGGRQRGVLHGCESFYPWTKSPTVAVTALFSWCLMFIYFLLAFRDFAFFLSFFLNI